MSDDNKKIAREIKHNTDALPNLKTSYKKLLNLFKKNGIDQIKEFVEGKITDKDLFLHILDEAANLILNTQNREKFEKHFKKYRHYLKIVIPKSAAEPYERPFKSFSHLISMVRKFEKEYPPLKRSIAAEKSTV
jgi:hypothetical protein